MDRLQQIFFAWLDHLITVLIVIVVITAQLAVTYFSPDLALHKVPEKDEVIFTAVASNLVSGQGYSITGELPTARRPPGYPLLLAGIFSLFGQSWQAARLANILLVALTLGLTYLLGAILFKRAVGLISVAVITIFYENFYETPLSIISDALFVFLLLTLLLILVKITAHPHAWPLKLLAGLVLGLGILTRSELILFIPFLLIWAGFSVAPKFDTAGQTLALVLGAAALVVLPWLIRNYLVFDRLTLATNLGRVLWGVYNPDTFSEPDYMGGWHPPELEIRNAAETPHRDWDPDYEYLPEPEWDQRQISLALDSLQENLPLLPKMELYKLYRFMYKSGATETQNLFRLPFIYCFFFGLFLLLASRNKRFLIIYLLLLYALSSALIFYPSERFRVAIDPILAIVAAYGLREQIGLIKSRWGRRPGE